MLEQPDFSISAQCAADQFTAHMEDAAGVVEFSGSLIADNHVVGQMSGKGPKRGDLSGSFELMPATELA